MSIPIVRRPELTGPVFGISLLWRRFVAPALAARCTRIDSAGLASTSSARWNSSLSRTADSSTRASFPSLSTAESANSSIRTHRGPRRSRPYLGSRRASVRPREYLWLVLLEMSLTHPRREPPPRCGLWSTFSNRRADGGKCAGRNTQPDPGPVVASVIVRQVTSASGGDVIERVVDARFVWLESGGKA